MTNHASQEMATAGKSCPCPARNPQLIVMLPIRPAVVGSPTGCDMSAHALRAHATTRNIAHASTALFRGSERASPSAIAVISNHPDNIAIMIDSCPPVAVWGSLRAMTLPAPREVG